MANPDALANVEGPLYAARKGVYPKKVDGHFRRLKWLIMAVTLAIYYGTPWIRWDRGPYAPDQAVLVDLANRRFYMFQIEIWPHEFYYVAGLLIMAGIGLFLVTSAVGRAWCGYACPQTVWTDLFQHVDRLIDGDRNAQIRLANGPWTAEKIGKRALKYGLYLAIAFWTGGAWIMYFADAPTLTREFWTGEAAYVAYATVGVLTATTFVLGGFMREQVCVYMCPWPRIQTAMMDEKSLLVTYKDWRGEPRGSLKSALAHPGSVGDCVDCNQCVAVCPTGIDIRTGPQIGCITCALCIDACDKVMAQVGRPRGLIDYCALDDVAVERAGRHRTAGDEDAAAPAADGLSRHLVRDRPRHAVHARPAHPARPGRAARAQPALCPAFRRHDPQQLHAQAAQHGSAAPQGGDHGQRAARCAALDRDRFARKGKPARRDDDLARQRHPRPPVRRRARQGAGAPGLHHRDARPGWRPARR
jgi:cytochrome c oxidase accessory protein FixG